MIKKALCYVFAVGFVFFVCTSMSAQTTVYNNFGPDHDGWDYNYQMGWTVCGIDHPTQYGVEQAMGFTSTEDGILSDIWVGMFSVPDNVSPDTVYVRLVLNTNGAYPDPADVLEEWTMTGFDSWNQWDPPVHLEGNGTTSLEQDENYWLWMEASDESNTGWCMNLDSSLLCEHTLRREGEDWLGVGNETASAFRVNVGNGMTFDPPTNLAVESNANEDFAAFTWDAPATPVAWTDNMDSYTAGEYLALQSDDWTTWSSSPGGADDGYVVDEMAYSGSNALKVEGTATDLVHEFGTFTTGVYEAAMMIYIEPGYGGYYNLMHYFNGTSSEWGMEVYFGSSGTGDLCATLQNVTSFTHPVGTWFESKCVIDLDADWAEYYIDGTMIYEWQWSIDTNGTPGSCEFGATDIYASAPTGDTVMFYCDDVMLSSVMTTRDLTGYNVYLDGVMQDYTTDTEWIFTDLTYGQTYTAAVEAVYDDGVSDLVELDFDYMGLGAGNNILPVTTLENNYPNPFNPSTNIAFSLANTGHVTLEVYNIKGEKVKTLIDGILDADYHTVVWNGTNYTGKSVTSGVYFYKMKSGTFAETKKMILMK